MKTYRRHYCSSRHRTIATLAKCMFSRAEWVNGSGPYACLAWCSVLTVSLHPTAAAAQETKSWIDRMFCGHACHGHHELIFIDLDGQYTA